MLLKKNGEFWNTAKGKSTGVFAKKNRGRWQYRLESGKILASGMQPAEFVKQFWFQDDLQIEGE